MTDQPIARPPVELLGEGKAPPEVQTLIAEVRSDASLSFNPLAAPSFLNLINVAFGALIIWRVDVSWNRAEEMQNWLTGAPVGPGLAATREEALKDFFDNIAVKNEQILDFVGIYLTTSVSHAQYTMVVGMRNPVPRDVYQSAFDSALSSVLASPLFTSWSADLVNFLKMMLNEPSSREEFLTLATNVRNSLSVPPKDWPPLIQRLV